MTENLFQHIWSGLYFETKGLKTTCGQSVSVIQQGTPNSGDGPDFRESEIHIDDITFFGDVELHLHAEDWYSHGHHRDSRYNRIILHVILSGEPVKPATLADGTSVPCLVLHPFISNQLKDVLEYTNQRQELACSGMLHLVSPNLIEKQFHKAHQAYFEYRVDQLMKHFNPSLPPSVSWKRMLTAGIFEGLGYSKNKTPMVELAHLMHKLTIADDSSENVERKAMSLSGLFNSTHSLPESLNRTSWDFSSSRPANQPPARIKQAAGVYFSLYNTDEKNWLSTKPVQLWKHLTHRSGMGVERATLIYSTVYLPALHILGSLFHDKQLTVDAFSLWMNQKNTLPAPIAKVYKRNGFPKGNYNRTLGAVYQYKHFCRESRCESCFVMQKLLQA